MKLAQNHVVANWVQFKLSVMFSYFYSQVCIIWPSESGTDSICSLWRLKITGLTCSEPFTLVIKLWPFFHCCFSFYIRGKVSTGGKLWCTQYPPSLPRLQESLTRQLVVLKFFISVYFHLNTSPSLQEQQKETCQMDTDVWRADKSGDSLPRGK